MKKAVLQVALDILELKRALQIAQESLDGGADWIEAGTPLIKSEGMQAIRSMRDRFPDSIIVADMKVADTGTLEVEMAAKAGANIVCILADADDSVIFESVRAASQYGIRIMADLINVTDPSGTMNSAAPDGPPQRRIGYVAFKKSPARRASERS